ncbi:sensor histidine kinase [Sphingomonas sp. MMS12-HWE2-04]|uniref:sensor histidine kinase n=1 Tax=Sphingomonas sp. MMS12-HWE2-04 TaxID=3234199 RepID=UPI00384EA3FA
MRFDDTLETVLAADLNTPYGVQSVWRQLVDLTGRRRVAPDRRTMATLRGIRPKVPLPVRLASARALEFANPPAPLVRLFALDELRVAIPVLRSARITASEWIELLSDLSPGARTILRNRRDLGPVVKRALESYGSVDFVLPDDHVPGEIPVPLDDPDWIDWTQVLSSRFADASPKKTVDESPRFGRPAEAASASVQGVSRYSQQPAAGEAVSRDPAGRESIAEASVPLHGPAMDQGGIAAAAQNAIDAASSADAGPFEIAEVVARIDAFWRDREGAPPVPREPVRAEQFRFETDAKGLIRWVDGVSRAPLVGLSLDQHGVGEGSRIDGIAGGAFRRRASFTNARLVVDSDSDAAGDWLISAIPVFDTANGRFAGYRGSARRPRSDERAELPRGASPRPRGTANSLRQLVHELRTPTNAIAGFAEMIEAQMLGPVSDAYRERANAIRAQARELLGAIDDLDLAARIDSSALALLPGTVALRPLLSGIVDDLSELTALRGSMIALPVHNFAVAGDRRAVERLLARLMATLVSASGTGERIGVDLAVDGEQVAIVIDRPAALADYPGESVLGIDDEREDSTLLGTGFALRLARNLARELGGSLVIAPDHLTLRLSAPVNSPVGQAHLS